MFILIIRVRWCPRNEKNFVFTIQEHLSASKPRLGSPATGLDWVLRLWRHGNMNRTSHAAHTGGLKSRPTGTKAPKKCLRKSLFNAKLLRTCTVGRKWSTWLDCLSNCAGRTVVQDLIAIGAVIPTGYQCRQTLFLSLAVHQNSLVDFCIKHPGVRIHRPLTHLDCLSNCTWRGLVQLNSAWLDYNHATHIFWTWTNQVLVPDNFGWILHGDILGWRCPLRGHVTLVR